MPSSTTNEINFPGGDFKAIWDAIDTLCRGVVPAQYGDVDQRNADYVERESFGFPCKKLVESKPTGPPSHPDTPFQSE